MSENYYIKHRTIDASASADELNTERSVLDVRKAYADMDLAKFVHMFRKYGIKAPLVTRILDNQAKILELCKDYALLSQQEFADHCYKTLKIKKDFVLMVLRDLEGGKP
jgi:hypothetical protein